MNPDALPSLRLALAHSGILADKRFGQHFLLDLNICRRIVRLSETQPGDTVIEVGPGPGGLTRALLEAGAKVIAIEKDPRFRPLLDDVTKASDGRLTIVEADALKIDETLFTGGPAAVVSNLPYNIGTPLLVKWLTGRFLPTSMTLMFQKEVALRIVAQPGEEHFGRLAVLSQAVCQPRLVMGLPARAFTPPPKVESAVVRLDPLPHRPADLVIEALQTVAQAAFGQRRKMLRSSLRSLGGEELCLRADIDPNIRAETVPVSGFLTLAAVMMADTAVGRAKPHRTSGP